jgi:hypothetical protein
VSHSLFSTTGKWFNPARRKDSAISADFPHCSKARRLTFLDQQPDDPIRVKDEIPPVGLGVANDGQQSRELVRAWESDRVGGSASRRGGELGGEDHLMILGAVL